MRYILILIFAELVTGNGKQTNPTFTIIDGKNNFTIKVKANDRPLFFTIALEAKSIDKWEYVTLDLQRKPTNIPAITEIRASEKFEYKYSMEKLKTYGLPKSTVYRFVLRYGHYRRPFKKSLYSKEFLY